jgi:hypothetical protein
MAAVEAPIIPTSISSGTIESAPAVHEEAQKAEDAETRAKFDKVLFPSLDLPLIHFPKFWCDTTVSYWLLLQIVTLLLRKLTEPFIHAENTVNRMHRLLNIGLLSEEVLFISVADPADSLSLGLKAHR